jgi:hypothetical protein
MFKILLINKQKVENKRITRKFVCELFQRTYDKKITENNVHHIWNHETIIEQELLNHERINIIWNGVNQELTYELYLEILHTNIRN